MEVEGEDGSKMVLPEGSNVLFGRGLGFKTDDRRVSRSHVSFEVKTPVDEVYEQTDPRVSFVVLGRNPVWVHRNESGEIRIFKKFENGELAIGDRFCIASRCPTWFTLKKHEFEGREEELADCIDVSEIDPVKEFGFLVMGHEFDHYPKHMIRDVKNWDWFLEERRKDSEDDEDFERKNNRGVRRKRNKAEGNEDDDEWRGEREDDKEMVAKLRKVGKVKYSTRSKDHNKSHLGTKSNIGSVQKKKNSLNAEDTKNDEDEDEDEDALGDFIVNDDNVKEEEEEEEKTDEEDFVGDDDEEMDD